MDKLDYGLIIGLGIIFFIGIGLVLFPSFKDNDPVTVRKISNIYNEPIYLTFHWITDDEIQVGKLITLDILVTGLPYEQDVDLQRIEIKFDESHVNYWLENNERQNKFNEGDTLILHQGMNNVFRTDPINLRFIVPEDISVQFCDYNLDVPCYEVENIIHPAPYDLANRIETNRIIISLTLVTASLSAIVVWNRLKESRKLH